MQGKLQKSPPTKVNLPENEDKVDHLEFFLRAGQSAQLFGDFLETEYSVENILFWKDVESFREKNKKDDSHLIDDANALYAKYISTQSAQPVNISSETRLALKKALEEAPSITMFDNAQQVIFDLMKNDTFPRFQHKSAAMLEDSWRRMSKKGTEHLGSSFYTILFAQWPEGEKLFPGGLKGVLRKASGKQNLMLITMVDTCVRLLGDLKNVISMVRATAKRHIGYNVKFEYFSIVGAAFIAFVAKEDAGAWDSKLEGSWKNLYQLMAGMMITAMSEAQTRETFKRLAEQKALKEDKQKSDKQKKQYFGNLTPTSKLSSSKQSNNLVLSSSKSSLMGDGSSRDATPDVSRPGTPNMSREHSSDGSGHGHGHLEMAEIQPKKKNENQKNKKKDGGRKDPSSNALVLDTDDPQTLILKEKLDTGKKTKKNKKKNKQKEKYKKLDKGHEGEGKEKESGCCSCIIL